MADTLYTNNMRHLHFRFITASLGFGLGFLMVIIVAWQARLYSAPGVHIGMFNWAVAALLTLGGGTLLSFGWHELNLEMFNLRR